MPEIRYYTVTEEREVKVWANNPIHAARIGDAHFRGAKVIAVPGATTTPIRVRDIVVREDF